MTLEKKEASSHSGISPIRVILVQRNSITLSWTGETIDNAETALAAYILGGGPSAHIAGTRLFTPLARLNADMQDGVPGWRMRFSTRRRHSHARDGRVVVGGRFFVDYLAITIALVTATLGSHEPPDGTT